MTGLSRQTGTENSLHTLLDDMQMDLTFMTSALQPMRMAPALRDAAGQGLAPTSKINVSVAFTAATDGRMLITNWA